MNTPAYRAGLLDGHGAKRRLAMTVDENGATHPGNTAGVAFNTDISSPLFFFVDTSATPFSAGTGPAITFNPGAFAIADGATDGEGTLTISAAPTPVPEPPTWLLAAGAAALGGIAQRWRRAPP